MNRSCFRVGKTGTWAGGITPLHAICNVVQCSFPGAESATIAVTSPTTLMSVLGRPACSPGGWAIG